VTSKRRWRIVVNREFASGRAESERCGQNPVIGYNDVRPAPPRAHRPQGVTCESRIGEVAVQTLDHSKITMFRSSVQFFQSNRAQPNRAQRHAALGAVTVGGDKGYQEQDFIKGLRKLSVTPHIAEHQKKRPRKMRDLFKERTG
jgi:hypothetical protein